MCLKDTPNRISSRIPIRAMPSTSAKIAISAILRQKNSSPRPLRTLRELPLLKKIPPAKSSLTNYPSVSHIANRAFNPR
ncbi:MAG: hypothetical protein K2J12_10520 [Muribaculaceae bacterium]|nr:hypothetical protein [Muribaculaceae bacterium]